MSSFVGLYTGLSGIQAAQTGIDVTSHNVANANTDGYTRQRVEAAARPGYRSLVGQMGTGVDVDAISRLRDGLLDARLRSSVADKAFSDVRAEFLMSLEELSGEPDLGISARLGGLWEAAEGWANDPADPASRRQVLAELSSIAERFRNTANAWDQLAADTDARLTTVVESTNAALQTVDELNVRMANADPSRIGPDIHDQRDRLLDEIAELTGAEISMDDDGRAVVTLGSAPLVTSGGPATITRAADGFEVEASNGVVTSLSTAGGELGGLHQALTVDLATWRTQLDALAASIADAVNDVNTSGVRADGTAGAQLLTYEDPGDPSASTLILANVTIEALAAAENGSPPPPHDGSNARRLADLRTTKVPLGSTDGETIEDQLADMIVGLAGDVRAAANTAEASRGVATGATLSRAAQHGVSLDEEMVNLVRYQRALESAARVMTAVDQALDVLVNRTGVVGR